MSLQGHKPSVAFHGNAGSLKPFVVAGARAPLLPLAHISAFRLNADEECVQENTRRMRGESTDEMTLGERWRLLIAAVCGEEACPGASPVHPFVVEQVAAGEVPLLAEVECSYARRLSGHNCTGTRPERQTAQRRTRCILVPRSAFPLAASATGSTRLRTLAVVARLSIVPLPTSITLATNSRTTTCLTVTHR